MIQTSFGPVGVNSTWMNPNEVQVRGVLKDEYVLQSDGTNNILRRKPKVIRNKTAYTYQE